MPLFKTQRVQALVTRSPMSAVPRVIFKHELPLLSEMFGEGNVQVVNAPSEVVGGPVSLDAKAEWARLSDIYGMHPEVSNTMVGHVFNNQIAMMIAAANEAVDAVDEVTNEDGVVSVEHVGKKNWDDVPTLRVALDALGVTYAKTAGKTALQDKLLTAAREQLKHHGVDFTDEMGVPEIMTLLASVEGGE